MYGKYARTKSNEKVKDQQDTNKKPASNQQETNKKPTKSQKAHKETNKSASSVSAVALRALCPFAKRSNL